MVDLYKWGKSSPSVNTVKLVADFFGVTVDEILSGQSLQDVDRPSA